MQVLLFKVPRPIKGRRQVFLQSEKDIMIKLTKQSFKNRLTVHCCNEFREKYLQRVLILIKLKT